MKMDTKARKVKSGKAKFAETFKLQTDFEKDPHDPSQILPKMVFASYYKVIVRFPGFE
jgi:hypothetical protein